MKYRAWITCLVSALFFLYEFIQINMFNSINQNIMSAYKLNSIGLGLLSSIYFYSTVVFLLPAGQILDKFSQKKVIILTIIICIVGIIGFAITSNIIIAAVCRFFEGVGSAFCFLGSFKIASNWFSKNKLAFVTSLIVTIGMLGGVVAQTPLTILVSQYGWREALLIDPGLGIVILISICVFVQDYPSGHKKRDLEKNNSTYWVTLKKAYFNKHNWACGLYTCLMNSPMVLLGALWGSLYLVQTDHFTRKSASMIISMMFIGAIIGSPIFGFFSSAIKSRKTLMIVGVIMTAIVVLFIMFVNNVNFIESIFLFFLIGVFSSSQVLGYPIAAQNGSQYTAAMSASVVSFTTMSGYLILQPLFGVVMDLFSKHDIVNGESVYTSVSYHYALLLIPVAVILAGISLVFVKDQNNKLAV